jgi:GTP-dependent phosphoenolpyruvate carboxykinase
MQDEKQVTKYTEQMQQAIGEIESWASEELGISEVFNENGTKDRPVSLNPVQQLEESLNHLQLETQTSYNDYIALNARNDVHGSKLRTKVISTATQLPFEGVIHKTNIQALQGMNELYNQAKDLERELLEKRKERDD